MKKFYFLIFTFFSFNLVFGSPVITAKQNGNWTTTGTWDKGRKPQDGDTIIIPSGKIVSYSDLISVESLKGVYVKVYGTLQLNGFWSSLSLDGNSTIVVYGGGMISSSGWFQTVYIGSVSVFASSLPSIVGPQMASFSTNGFTAFNPLPVKFVGFTVTKKNNDVLIQWSTSEEIDANTYEVERSENGVSWSTIAYVAAIGNSSAVNNYSYTDKNISAKVVYYRVKEVDVDGKTSLTAIKSIKASAAYTNTDIKIASVQNKVLLQFPNEIKGSLTVRFISMNGQLVDQQTVSNPLGQVVLNSKVTGSYVISVSNGQDVNTAKQVIL